MNAIKTDLLTKKYGDFTAVDHINLEIHEGELFSILGVNGAGKSTLLRMLTCLTPPSSGNAQICGHNILTEPDAVHSLINLSPQENAVAPNLTVRENLELIAGIYGIADPQNAVEDMLERFTFRDMENRRAKALSGGWQRQLSLAMALISRPKIVFLDEPTLGLDVIARRRLWQTIARFKPLMTIILTTHSMEETEALSDRVAILQKGRLKAIGTPAELIAQANATNFEDAFLTLSGGMEA